jgi:RNA polymerase sigma factor (sigma-70 family)
VDAVNDPGLTPPAGDRDAETVELLRRGDADGLRQLLADHGGAVHAALRRTFGSYLSDAEVEEALEAALVRVWGASGGTPPPQATLRSWLYVIARNCGLSLVRRRKRQKEQPLDEFTEMLTTMAGGRSEQERLRRLADLHHCLRELAPMQRHVLQADLDANGTADVATLAQRLATSPAVVYVARSRGRSELRRMMQRLGHYVDEGPAPRTAAEPRPEFG